MNTSSSIPKPGTKFSVIAHPGSRKGDAVVLENDTLVVHTKARAIDGKANEAIAKLLAKHFGVASSRVALLRGAKSRHKLYEIR